MRSKIPELVVRGATYYVQWYDPAKKRYERQSLKTKDPGEATRQYAIFLLGDGVGFGRHAELTVDDVLDSYYREHVKVKCADPGRQEYAIFSLKGFFAKTLVHKIDIQACRDYGAARMAGKVKVFGRDSTIATQSTVRRELSVLSAACHHAKRWKRLSPADMPLIEMPPDSEPSPEFFTKAEIEWLREASREKMHDFITIAYYTAARRDSIARLRVEQVDQSRKLIHLRQPGERSTRKRKPTVPLFPEIEESVQRRISEARDGYLFSKGTDYYAPFAKLCADMGFPQHRRKPHMLRHSRATHLLNDGVPIFHVAKLLGDTVATVERTYGKWIPTDLAEILAKPRPDLSDLSGMLSRITQEEQG